MVFDEPFEVLEEGLGFCLVGISYFGFFGVLSFGSIFSWDGKVFVDVVVWVGCSTTHLELKGGRH